MASDSILRLKVDSKEYDSKLKSATDALTRYIEGCRKVGGTMEVVEADTLNYVRSLGQMQTKSQSTRGAMSEMSKTFTELSMAYRQLTSEEKSSPFGTALRDSLEQLAERTRNTKQQLQEINDQLNTEPKNSFSSIVSTMGSMSMAIQGVYGGLSTLSGAVTEMTEAFSVQEQAELRLQTIMRQRMGASEQDIEKIKQLTAEQQKLGVIGDEVQLAGAQQVATFLSERQSLELLIPAMNDLAAQQKGLNVTSDDMVNIGNMFGKVMQGVGDRCLKHGVPAAALCGGLGEGYDKIFEHGIDSIMTTVDGPMPLAEALDRAEELYYAGAVRLFRMVRAGMKIQGKQIFSAQTPNVQSIGSLEDQALAAGAAQEFDDRGMTTE